MKRHYFLGTAAGWDRTEIKQQRKATGAPGDTAKLCDYLCREYGGTQAIVTQNGRSAIAAALKYRVKTPGEVIVNGLTCQAVVQGVKAAGFTPVYADIDRETLNFTSKTLRRVLTSTTRAVIVQNTLGNMANIREIEEFCIKHKLVLVEDLAHSTGRVYSDGREAGTVGEITVFSFGKEKAIDVVSGGAVVFRDHKIPAVTQPQELPPEIEIRRARMYPTYGLWYRRLSYVGLHGVLMRLLLRTGRVIKSADGDVDFTRYRLTDWQAKLALKKLRKRRQLAEKPLREFYLVKNRSTVLGELRKAGYYFDGVWYDTPVGPARYYARLEFPEQECPVAVEVAKQIVNLPNYYNTEELAPAKEIILRNLADDVSRRMRG